MLMIWLGGTYIGFEALKMIYAGYKIWKESKDA